MGSVDDGPPVGSVDVPPVGSVDESTPVGSVDEGANGVGDRLLLPPPPSLVEVGDPLLLESGTGGSPVVLGLVSPVVLGFGTGGSSELVGGLGSPVVLGFGTGGSPELVGGFGGTPELFGVVGTGGILVGKPLVGVVGNGPGPPLVGGVRGPTITMYNCTVKLTPTVTCLALTPTPA